MRVERQKVGWFSALGGFPQQEVARQKFGIQSRAGFNSERSAGEGRGSSTLSSPGHSVTFTLARPQETTRYTRERTPKAHHSPDPNHKRRGEGAEARARKVLDIARGRFQSLVCYFYALFLVDFEEFCVFWGGIIHCSLHIQSAR